MIYEIYKISRCRGRARELWICRTRPDGFQVKLFEHNNFPNGMVADFDKINACTDMYAECTVL